MGHEWIFDVLKDLASYARANGLPALAGKADEALRVAEVEILNAGRPVSRDTGGGGMGPAGKLH